MAKRGRKFGSGKFDREQIIYARIPTGLKEELLKVTEEKTISEAVRKAVKHYMTYCKRMKNRWEERRRQDEMMSEVTEKLAELDLFKPEAPRIIFTIVDRPENVKVDS